MKFKVGDRVKFVGQAYDYGYATVIDVDLELPFPYTVRFYDVTSGPGGWACTEDELELIP